MKKIKHTLITILSIYSLSIYASDFDYFITGDFAKGHHLHLKYDLPSDFLDKEQTIEKEFEISELTAKENGKYKVTFYNSTEHSPKRKVVVFLYKFNPKLGKLEILNTNFYFFEDTKFWFISRTPLTPDDFLSVGISNKKYFEKK